MAVNISGLRRNIKNVAHNYTDAQVKVREATSNDPWGPSSTQMSEIADLTYNVVAFAEIMQMIWKRLNDHGKNWRHVYKSLVLLEYLIKTGSDKVAQQCKENIFAIQTLKDFQYLDDNKDQGINVREKAKALVALLKDDERLRNERVRALKAKERFAQSTAGIGSDTVYTGNHDRASSRVRSPVDELQAEIEAARPQTAGEEELQLQLALAMSREEAEQEATKNRSDDMRLQLAIQKSKEEDGPTDNAVRMEDLETAKTRRVSSGKPSSDLLDLDFGNPVTMTDAPQPAPPPRNVSLDPWGAPVVEADPWGGGGAAQQPDNPDPWSPVNPPQQQRTSPMPGFNSSSPARIGSGATNDPWNAPPPPATTDLASAFSTNGASTNDPWLPSSASPAPGGPAPSGPAQPVDPFSPTAQNQLAEFDMLRSEIEKENNGNGGTTSPNPFDLGGMGAALPTEATGAKPKKTVESLLGEHSKLVNLDDLVTQKPQPGGVFVSDRNPFEGQPQNPFHAQKKAQPAMNQLLNSGWTQQQQQQQQQQQNLNQAGDFNPFF